MKILITQKRVLVAKVMITEVKMIVSISNNNSGNNGNNDDKKLVR